MPRPLRTFMVLFLTLSCAACTAALEPQPPPVAVGHLDMSQKEEYIYRTASTLKRFHAAASDLRSRALSGPLEELGENFDRYVAMQVSPIVEDAEARNNLATRMEVAKLQLLCGLIYVELQQHQKVETVLAQMSDYEADQRFLSTPIGSDLGVSGIEEGLKILRKSVAEASSRR